MATDNARGPLAGLRVLEFEAIGPAPFCGMMLADMGADVLLADRTEDPRLGFGRERWYDIMLRGRRSVTLDLKTDAGAASARLLASRADVVIEGFRPGVMERLGLGPETLLALNPANRKLYPRQRRLALVHYRHDGKKARSARIQTERIVVVG